MTVALHVNVDHVATLRQARGSAYPDPVHAAVFCERAGADGITIHLREDRRHIQDRDVDVMAQVVQTRLNLEMGATAEMVGIALRVKPDLVTLVPEKREERTTEGGLDVAGQLTSLRPMIETLRAASIPVSLFIDPDEKQVAAAAELRAEAIELHTGDYANAADPAAELGRLLGAARLCARKHPSIHVAAGHGLTIRNVGELVRAVTPIVELNIGHALICDSVFVGLEDAVRDFRAAIDDGESQRE